MFVILFHEIFLMSIILNAIVQVMNLIGDVKGKVAVMVDDMIDTAGELSHLDVKNPSL